MIITHESFYLSTQLKVLFWLFEIVGVALWSCNRSNIRCIGLSAQFELFYVIYLLESAIRGNQFYSTSLLGLSKYTLEHLMPKKWRNNWKIQITEKEEMERDRLLQTLGNLAIITGSLNSSIRDAEWDVKLNGKNNKSGLKSYASGLQTMSDVLDKVDWNEKYIEERSMNLYKYAVKVWDIEDYSFDLDVYLSENKKNISSTNQDNAFKEEENNQQKFTSIKNREDILKQSDAFANIDQMFVDLQNKTQSLPPQPLPTEFSDIMDGKYIYNDNVIYIISRKCIEPSGKIRVNKKVYNPLNGKTRATGSITSLRKIIARIENENNK